MKSIRLPDAFTLLLGCVALAAILSYLLPAGEFDRRQDPATDRQVVVPGSYHHVPSSPVGPFAAATAVPRGMIDAASVVFLVFIIGGAFAVVDETGALKHGAEWLAGRLGSRGALVVPISCVLFALGGTLEGMWEEVVALTPVMVMLSRRVGFDAVTAVSMSVGAAGIGGSFAVVNPFSVGIAQKFAQLPLLSGAWYRVIVQILALAIWIWGTLRHARKTATAPSESSIGSVRSLSANHALTLLAVIAAFAVYVTGTLRYGWGFEEMGAIFLVMGLAAGLLGGLGVAGTANAFTNGFRTMAYGALLIGVARAMFVVMNDAKIVDTIINAMVTPLSTLPSSVFAIGMMCVQSVIGIAVPSTSGRAVLTMPILVPLSDLLGVSRQVTVLAYQYGPGVIGQMVPTDGALMAILALAGVPYGRWLRFALPICAILFVFSIGAVVVAIAIGLR